MHLLFELKAFLFAADFPRTQQPTVQSLEEYLEGLDGEKLADLVKKKARIQYVVPPPNSMLYIPTGWICMEYAQEGALIVGSQKALFLKAPSACQILISYYKACAYMPKSCEKMEAILQFMK